MQKEIKVSQYFRECFAHSKSQVVVPEVVDHWQASSGDFAVFEWCSFSRMGFLGCFGEVSSFEKWKSMMSLLRAIPRPDWWDPEKHVWVDHLEAVNIAGCKALSPFGIDFDNNVGVLEDGSLAIFDFEHIQWGEQGLLDSLIAMQFIGLSGKQFALQCFRRGRLDEWWRDVRNTVPVDRPLLLRAHSILSKSLRKHMGVSVSARARLAACTYLLLRD